MGLDLIDLTIRESKKSPDSDGFIFLTNAPNTAPSPREFAVHHGFKLPIFKMKRPKRRIGMLKEEYENLCYSHIGWWVKEGLDNEAKN